MSDQFEPSASPASDDEATLQSERLTEHTSLDAGDTSRLPPDAQASAGLTQPRFARLARQLDGAGQPGRRVSRLGSVGGLILAALVVALIGFVLVHLAPAHSTLADSPTGTPSVTALGTATTAATTTTDSATPASTATARAASGGSGTSNNGGGVNQPAGPVFAELFSLNVDSMTRSGNAFSTNECSQTVTVDTAYTLTVQPPATEVHYYVRHSDGTSDGSAAQPHAITFVQNPAVAGGVPLDSSWTFPYTLATGSPQWLELDILTPAPFTLRVDFTALCTFSPETPTLAVTPQSYNCAAGGNQTFTFTGNLHASYAVGSHTVTYHWKRYDGSVTPDQTVTFAQGVTSILAQPDTMVINSSVFPTAPVDILVVSNQTGGASETPLSPAICFPTPTPVIPTATPTS